MKFFGGPFHFHNSVRDKYKVLRRTLSISSERFEFCSLSHKICSQNTNYSYLILSSYLLLFISAPPLLVLRSFLAPFLLLISSSSSYLLLFFLSPPLLLSSIPSSWLLFLGPPLLLSFSKKPSGWLGVGLDAG